MKVFESKIKKIKREDSYRFDLIDHRYIYDYFFPRSSYFDAIGTFIPHSHPFIDKRMLQFLFSHPAHIHCDYLNYKEGQSYLRATFLARQAYQKILPDYARLKEKKTFYAGMARKIISNSKNDIVHFLYDRNSLFLDELNLIDSYKFKKHVGALLLKAEDPNNDFGINFQYIQKALQMEIWLYVVNGTQAHFKNLTKPKAPRNLTEIEWINQ